MPACSGSRTAEREREADLSGGLRWSVIGRSVEDRPIEAVTLGRGPLKVYIIGSIHGDEPEGLATVEPVLAAAQRGPLAGLATVRVVRDANPDGTEARTRGNARRRDLNRNWPAGNFATSPRHGESPLSEPETRAVHTDLTRFSPDLVVVFHSARSGPFVNYDGPAASLAAAFASAAAQSDERWRVVRDMGYATPGSLGTYLGVERRVPILTIEFRRGQDAASAMLAGRAGFEAAVEAAAAAR